MSLESVSRVLRALQLDSQQGLFTIDVARLEYVPFDLTGTLVVTGIESNETTLERILEALKTRFGINVSLYLVGISERGHIVGPKLFTVGQLVTVGADFLEEETMNLGVNGQWCLVKASTLESVDSTNKTELANENASMLTTQAGSTVTPQEASEFTLAPLVDVVAALRAPNGCPWDRLQTHSTLRRYLLEEVYEVLEAIDNHDMANLREELGDVLLQIVFHARLAEEQGLFTMQEIIDDISAKMIRRHPHVFNRANSEEVATTQLNWEALKAQEPGHAKKTLLAGVSKELPALLGAQKLQEKAAKVGFDWDSEPPVWAKFEEEIAEFKEAVALGNYENAELEGGDVLFSLINLLRWYKIGGENALNRTNNKFRRRFAYVERCVKDSGRSWEDFSLDELDSFWDSAKVSEQKHSLK